MATKKKSASKKKPAKKVAKKANKYKGFPDDGDLDSALFFGFDESGNSIEKEGFNDLIDVESDASDNCREGEVIYVYKLVPYAKVTKGVTITEML